MISLMREIGEAAAWTAKQLGQVKPASAGTPVVLYQLPSSKVIVTYIETIVVANTHTASIPFSIYLDADGTTADATTTLYYDVVIPANSTLIINPSGLYLNDIAGSLKVGVTSTGDKINFSAYGIEISTNRG